jgi:nitroimidazol reductase NimA-like FMN-containing flavoprotein (pyridoxamine 5'-phosphate oxidase superfamily)
MELNQTRSRTTILGASECWTLLRSSDVGRLAVSVADQPDIFPVNFVVDHGTLVIVTAEGSKLSAVTANPLVAFEVDAYDAEAGTAWSVVVKGTAEEVRRIDDLVEAMGLVLFPWHEAPQQQFLRIVPDEITGRRFVASPGANAPISPRRRASFE